MSHHCFLRLFHLLLILAALLTGCATRYEVVDDPAPVTIRVPDYPIRLALVLGGGGARGMAHVGVLEEFERAGITVDALVGCSAGSIVAALYADCPDAQYVRQLLEPLKKWDILDVNIWQCRYGLVQGRSLRKFLQRNLSCKTFEGMKIPLYVVATDVIAGELITFSKGAVLPTIHASAAVPFLFAPVLYKGRLLVDGGVTDPIPVGSAKAMGAELVVAVDLSQLLPRTCPKHLFGIAKRSAEIKFLLQSEGCCTGADVIIRPELGEVGMFNDKEQESMYQAGCQAAREAIPQIIELLSRNKDARDAAP